MAFKIVGADENSDFPARVETRLASKFTNAAYVDAAETSAVSTSNAYTDDEVSTAQTAAVASAKTYTDTAISNIELPGGLVEDPEDPGFFI